jgi:hypothetical protein
MTAQALTIDIDAFLPQNLNFKHASKIGCMQFLVNAWQRFDVRGTGFVNFDEFCIMMGPVRVRELSHTHTHTHTHTHELMTSHTNEHSHGYAYLRDQAGPDLPVPDFSWFFVH